ncbi:MAG: CcmD family protein [Acidobacteriia bacterium]|nr:CcmD family protein [Terriglobia bacterium]
MNNYLVAAYAVIWIVLLAYVFVLNRKCRKLTEELRSLREQIENRNP